MVDPEHLAVATGIWTIHVYHECHKLSIAYNTKIACDRPSCMYAMVKADDLVVGKWLSSRHNEIVADANMNL